MSSISPLDGRYADRLASYRHSFSEKAVYRAKIDVELHYLLFLLNLLGIETRTDFLQSYILYDDADLLAIKKLEKETRHDIVAIVKFLQPKVAECEGDKVAALLHFGLTSEDVNSLAWAKLVGNGELYLKNTKLILNQKLYKLTQKTSQSKMLSFTHGQPSVPTTFGKEIKVFQYRLRMLRMRPVDLSVKFGGANGSMNAHYHAMPHIEWEYELEKFVSEYSAESISGFLNVKRQDRTTQVSNGDDLAEYFQGLIRFNNVAIDLCQDLWLYGLKGYISQKHSGLGSSTMPHKSNPVEIENAEGNLQIANVLLNLFCQKCTISRLQRDLSWSTVRRNIGVAFGHMEIAYRNLLKGIDRIEVNEELMKAELLENKQVFLEAIQTELRFDGVLNATSVAKECADEYEISDDDVLNYVGNSVK